MKVYYPDIFESFHCIGSECKDNCCKIGWDIEIDNNTLAFYRSLKDDMGKRLCDAIYEEDGCHYMGQDGGCPFLNEKGLCSVLLKYGEDKISEICAQHPRFYEWFGGYKEAGVGLSCEEVSRLLCTHSQPIKFYEKHTDEADDTLEYNKVIFNAVKEIRDNLIKLMQDKGLDTKQKLYVILHTAIDLQNCLDEENEDDLDEVADILCDKKYIERVLSSAKTDGSKAEKKKIYEGILTYFKGLDYLHDDFLNMLCEAEKNLDRIIDNEDSFDKFYRFREYEYENLAIYFIYRYLLKATRDYDGYSKLLYAAVSVILVRLVDMNEYSKTGRLDVATQIFIVKEYSKEVEYSAENAENIFDDLYCDSRFAVDNLRKLLM